MGTIIGLDGARYHVVKTPIVIGPVTLRSVRSSGCSGRFYLTQTVALKDGAEITFFHDTAPNYVPSNDDNRWS